MEAGLACPRHLWIIGVWSHGINTDLLSTKALDSHAFCLHLDAVSLTAIIACVDQSEMSHITSQTKVYNSICCTPPEGIRHSLRRLQGAIGCTALAAGFAFSCTYLQQEQVVWLLAGLSGVCHQALDVALLSQSHNDLAADVGRLVDL